MRIANQIYIGNAKNPDTAKEVIALTYGSFVEPKSLRSIVPRGGNNKGKVIGFVADFEDFEKKMAILRGSKKLQETEHLKNVYHKPNQTAKERQWEKALKEEVNQLRENLEDTATDFPVIRNGRIVFLPRRLETSRT